MLKLFFIAYTDENGDNYDYFIWAADLRKATRIFMETLEMEVMPNNDRPRFQEIALLPPVEPSLVKWNLQLINEEFFS